MNIKKHISIRNWEKYQSRTDKKMPWCKLWGMIFDEEWWQEMSDKDKIVPIVFLDVARKFINRCPVSYDWYHRNYNLRLNEGDWILLCKALKEHGFLSDLPENYLGQHKRVEESRVEESRKEQAKAPSEPVDNSKLETLKSLCVKIDKIHSFHKVYVFLSHLRKHRDGEYPPIDVTINVLKSAIKCRPKEWWPYLVMAFRKELPQYYAELSMKAGEQYKRELEQSAGDVLRQVMERKT